MTKTYDPLLTPNEVADWLRTSPARLSNLRSAGLGPTFVRQGRAIRYRVSDVEAYLNVNTVTPIAA